MSLFLSIEALRISTIDISGTRGEQQLMLIVHSLKSIASGLLGSAEASKIQADVSENWVTVSGGDAEFHQETLILKDSGVPHTS